MRIARSDMQYKPASARLAPLWGPSSLNILICNNGAVAILEPFATSGCEVWGPANAAIWTLQEAQTLQHFILCRACLVRSSALTEVIFQELPVIRGHGCLWQRVISIWNTVVQSDSAKISNIVLHDTIALAQPGSSFGWAAQVCRCCAEHGKVSPLMAGALVEARPVELLLAFRMLQQATCKAVPLEFGLALVQA